MKTWAASEEKCSALAAIQGGHEKKFGNTSKKGLKTRWHGIGLSVYAGT